MVRRLSIKICCWSIVSIAAADLLIGPDGSANSASDPSAASNVPLLESLFPLEEFLAAYEKRPLLSRRHARSIDDGNSTSALHSERITSILSLPHPLRPSFPPPFRLDDLEAIVSLPNMIHTVDYTLLKLVPRDGQEWSAHPPIVDEIPPNSIRQLFETLGFTLVVNQVQNRWPAVARYVRTLETELTDRLGYSLGGASVNLYATPAHDLPPPQMDGPTDAEERCCRGFETHFDWMDVVVLQISGAKRWAVWTGEGPLSYLPPGSDAKYKPSAEELAGRRGVEMVEEVTLREGDVLYLPRGYLHNASTAPLDDSSRGVPSVHLTFGLEHHCCSTLEGAAHRAVEMFFDEEDKDLAGDNESPWCGGEYAGRRTLLHAAVAEVVRRDCGGYGEANKGEERGRSADQGGDACLLRRSLAVRHMGGGEGEGEYTRGIAGVATSADLKTTLQFHEEMVSTQESEGITDVDMRSNFCYPQFQPEDYLRACDVSSTFADSTGPSKRRQRRLEKSFRVVLERFMNYATDNAEKVLMKSEKDILEQRRQRWLNQKKKLTKIHGGRV